jgi:hypothetical protein
MGNLLIYSAVEIFCAWPPALPRCLMLRQVAPTTKDYSARGARAAVQLLFGGPR